MAKPEPMVVLVLPLAEAEELAEVLTYATDASLEVAGPLAVGAATLQIRALRRMRAALEAADRAAEGGE